MTSREQETAMYDQPGGEMMTDEELIEEARKWPRELEGNLINDLADALEQSRIRVVETVEELDALPENTVIREHMHGSIQQRGSEHWWGIASSRPTPGLIPLPVRVLYIPDALGVRE